jgi:hypothetical protein
MNHQPPVIRPSGTSSPALVFILFVAFFAVCFYGYGRWTVNSDQHVVEDWIRNNPIDAMILKRHPDTWPRFVQHFTPYYQKQGRLGLEEGQLEMLQIAHVNYITDYIWQIGDRELDQFLKAQYVLTSSLIRDKDGQRLCQAYYANSALFNQVRDTVGDRVFVDYMKAIERLMLSAEVNPTSGITPDSPHYITDSRSAMQAVMTEYGRLATLAGLRDRNTGPTQNCPGFALYLHALLNVDPSTRSLAWRSAMESFRPSGEAARRAANKFLQ